MKKLHKLKWCLGALVAICVSCSTSKQISYLLDMDYNTEYPAPPAEDLKIQAHDVLNITVYSTNAQLSEPFNTISGVSGTSQSTEYIVNGDGDIDFPILGTLHVERLTAQQIRDMIASRIEEEGYIRHPIVKVSLKDFKVTVIGRTNNCVLTIDNGCINILQAIARSGELGHTSRFRDVTVIRTQDGKREAYHVDLQSKSLFESPVFYLQQNDIVYIKPRGKHLSAAGGNTISFINMGLSVLSIVMNYIIWGLKR